MTLRGFTLVTLKILAVAASSGALMLLAFYASVRLLISGNEVVVPDLAGLSEVQARSRLQATGLYLEPEAERYDPQVAAGGIIEQSPAAGRNIKTRRKVKVVMSLGTEELDVPDLAGKTERSALLEIERLGLRAGDVARVTSSVPAQQVIAQDPLPDSVTFRGERVNLLISRGPREAVYVMPDLSGRPLPMAQRVLGERGLRIGKTDRQPSTRPEGQIVRQFPRAGFPVTRRDTIVLTMSSGSFY